MTVEMLYKLTSLSILPRNFLYMWDMNTGKGITPTQKERSYKVFTPRFQKKYIKNITEEVATGLYEQIIDGHVN